MRIAVIADPLDNQRAGVHVYTRNLVNTLIQNRGDHEIVIIREKKDEGLTGCEQISVPNIRLPIGFASFRLFFLIPFIIRKHQIDVVIEPAHFGPFNLPDKIFRVTMIHDLTPLLLPHHHRWHSQWLQRLFLKRILRRTHLILSNSNHTANDIKTVFPFTEKKVETIHLGKDTFYRRASKDQKLREYGITKPFFHYVGTIEPRKGLLTLLSAFGRYKSQRPGDEISLVIAGARGWKSETFFSALDQHPYKDDIMITGYVEKELLPVLHTYSRALIYPSTYEGFGLPVLEALSCGGTVITARNSSLTEVGGDQAIYFTTDDAHDLCEQMLALDRESFTSSVINARIAWSDQFDWNLYGKHLIQLLEDKLNGNE